MAGERGSGKLRCKKTKLNKDRISELPDCILLHILSFLSTKEVVRTCLLSKRWQFLWTDISEIDLVEESHDIDKVRSFVDWVWRMLVMCSGNHLNKFAVNFWGQDFSTNINLWVRFLVKNKVKYVTLRSPLHRLEFMLPQILYSHSSLTSLTVSFCHMFLRRGAIKWGSLKSLSIELTIFQDNVIEEILSGSPVLEVLRIRDCWGLTCLNISTPSLATLVIEDWEIHEEDECLEISAPYVLDLSIIDKRGRYEFRLRNVSSVVRAKLYLEGGEIEKRDDLLKAMDYMKQFLESLKSVKELELGPWCIRVLSVLEVEGWQFPTSTLKSLTLNVCRDKRSIPGVLGILKSSPKLETLVIKGESFPNYRKDNDPVGPAAAYLQNGNMDLVLSYLKTIKITTFTKSFGSIEPMATLVQILFKGATVLEKMVISAKELDITKSAVTLISFPRASPRSVVVFD